MENISEGIFFEDSYLGITLGAIILSHGVIMIDSPLRSEDSRSWRSTLINQRGGPNRLLVYMDDHPDRTLGARAMECTITAHEKTAETFRNRPTIFKGQSFDTGSVWETYSDAIGLRWSIPDITFTEKFSIHWDEKIVILQHKPGPTPGSIWVEIPDADILFVGDTVPLEQPPFLDRADIDQWLENLDYLSKSFRKYIIVSSRGGVVERDHIRHLQRNLKKIKKDIEKLAEAGASPEETETLIQALLSSYTIPRNLESLYENRLRHGIYQYYVRSYSADHTMTGLSDLI